MKLLLDTHSFLWWIADDERLPRRARRAIGDPRNEVYFSTVSAWEIAVKASLGRVTLDEEPARFIPGQLELNDFSVLPLRLEHALAVSTLPDIHRDPFDRMLIAQAKAEGASLVTGDKTLQRYPIKITW